MYKWYAKRPKGSKANGLQVVGWPNSTVEGAKSKRYKRRREVENMKAFLAFIAMRNKLKGETLATRRR